MSLGLSSITKWLRSDRGDFSTIMIADKFNDCDSLNEFCNVLWPFKRFIRLLQIFHVFGAPDAITSSVVAVKLLQVNIVFRFLHKIHM